MTKRLPPAFSGLLSPVWKRSRFAVIADQLLPERLCSSETPTPEIVRFWISIFASSSLRSGTSVFRLFMAKKGSEPNPAHFLILEIIDRHLARRSARRSRILP